MLLKIGKAARHRFAARIDYRGIGQNKMDQPGLKPVHRQLVDKIRTIAFAVPPGVRKVAVSQIPQLVSVQIGNDIGIARLHVLPPVRNEPADQCRNFVQFGGAFDLGVAG